MSGRINRVMEGLRAACLHIGEDPTWYSGSPATVDLAVCAPDVLALARPAVLIRLESVRDILPETDTTMEQNVGTGTFELVCIAGDGGYGATAAREVNDLMEDAARAVSRDFQLSDGIEDDDTRLAFYAQPTSMELDTEASAVFGIAIGVVTVTVKLDFPSREGGV